MTDSIKILRIQYENIPLFHDGCFEFSFLAEDRVSDPAQVFQLRKNLYTQKLTALQKRAYQQVWRMPHLLHTLRRDSRFHGSQG